MTTWLKSARNPDTEVIVHPDPAARSGFGIKLTNKKKTKVKEPKNALDKLKVCIQDRTLSQTVTTLKNILSRWEDDRRISDATKSKINLAKKEFDKKLGESEGITIADILEVFQSITKDLKKH